MTTHLVTLQVPPTHRKQGDEAWAIKYPVHNEVYPAAAYKYLRWNMFDAVWVHAVFSIFLFPDSRFQKRAGQDDDQIPYPSLFFLKQQEAGMISPVALECIEKSIFNPCPTGTDRVLYPLDRDFAQKVQVHYFSESCLLDFMISRSFLVLAPGLRMNPAIWGNAHKVSRWGDA